MPTNPPVAAAISDGGPSYGDELHSTPDMTWLDRAACGDLPLDQLNMFFVEAGRTIAPSTIALCRCCPVRSACLDHAYRNQIFSGYFGGVSPGQRRTMTIEEARTIISVR